MGAEPTSYDLHGHHAAVSVPDAATRAVVARILADLASPAHARPVGAVPYLLDGDVERGWSVHANGSPTYGADSLTDALVALEWHLVTDMLAARRDLFHIHGASLVAPDRSSSLLIAGLSGSGKTTLTLGLMARGFLPCADDTTLIDPTTLAPRVFRRAFHVDRHTEDLVAAIPGGSAWAFDPATPGFFRPPQWASDPAPIRSILFPSVRPGAEPRVAPLSLADAARTLLPFSATLADAPALALAVAARLTAWAACGSLIIGDLDATLDRVVAWVEANDGRETRASGPQR